MNETIKNILSRRSIRKYKPDMIPNNIIDEIIIAGTYAANKMGKQSTIIIAVTNKELRDKLSEMNCRIANWKDGYDPFFGAPVVLVVLADKNWDNHIYDGSLVMGNLMLAAHSFNISSCWIQRAKEEFETDEGKNHFTRARHKWRLRRHWTLYTWIS